MNLGDSIKGLTFRRSGNDERVDEGTMDGGQRDSEPENPYLAARRTWNDQSAANIASRQMFQLLGVLALLVALAGVGGAVYIGSQSKFIPYVIEVDRLGQPRAAGPADRAALPSPA